MVALEMLQDFAGQSVKLNQCLIQLFDMCKKLPECCNSSVVSGMDLMCETEGGGPHPVEVFDVHLLEAFSDGCVIAFFL